jgi:tRNA (adenine58-N1)-methyltransferase non-catalytic subunit
LKKKTILHTEDTDATNELINDGQFVQPLTLDEIETLKHSGVHASVQYSFLHGKHGSSRSRISSRSRSNSMLIIRSRQNIAKRSTNNGRKRSTSEWTVGDIPNLFFRYSKYFTTVEPTLFNVCEYWFNKDQNRIRGLRSDTLSQLLNLANIRPGGRYLAVDDASGLVVSAILERMGGNTVLSFQKAL